VNSFLSREALDNMGRSASLEYPDGEVVVSSYDRSGIQITLTGYGDFLGYGSQYGRQVYLAGATATSAGRLSSRHFGNSVTTEMHYDEGRTQYQSGGIPITNRHYRK